MHTLHAKDLRKKKWLKALASLAVILLAFGLSFSLLKIFYSSEPVVPAVPAVQNPTPAVDMGENIKEQLPPQRVEIPRIGVSAPVLPVGLTEDNDMAISDDADGAAWYKFGPTPGEVGNAVIAGHYGLKNGKKSAFHDLRELKAGDTILVRDENDAELTFIVREIRTYTLDADATEVFRSNDGKAHLNLITCDGYWNKDMQTYADRLVVFSDLVTTQ